MRSSKVRTEIHNLLDLLLKSGVAVYINPVVAQQDKGGLTRVTWANTRSIPGGLFRGDFATIDDYCGWLAAGAFSAILFDGAVLQFSYDFTSNYLTGHRLAYYPCPFDVEEELLRTEPVLDVIELYRSHSASSIRLRSPLRFDYDPQSGSHDHPTAHLTLLSSHCRWPIVAPLSPGHFVRFLFKHFYPSLWSALRFLREWPQQLGERTITAEQEEMLHVSCTR